MVPILLLAVVALAFIGMGSAGAKGAPAPRPVGPGLPPPPQPAPQPVPASSPADGGITVTPVGLPSPGITPGTIFGERGQGIPTTSRQAAANAMNNELARVGGFRLYDQPVYKAYQSAAGLTTDGFPGTHTMNSLATDVAAMGGTLASVPIFAWKSRTGTMQDYDGVNAPTAAEWLTPAPN